MTIETPRLILRELTPEDFDALHEILSDPETMRHYPKPFDEARTRGWIEWNLRNYAEHGFGLWAVVLRKTGALIGDCGLTLQNIDGDILPEIGYHIHKSHWRRGLGSEAARAVRDWAFENTRYDCLYSYMKYTNVASYSTAIANGMTKVKEYPDEKNGISCAYAITRAQWEALRERDKPTFLPVSTDRMDELRALHTAYKREIGEDAPSDADIANLRRAMDAGDIAFYGCARGGKLVACCSVCVTYSTFNYGRAGVFEDFYILPEHRHKGIARRLAAYAYAQSGVSSMTVGCADCDRGMYTAIGFDIPLGHLLAYSGETP